MPCISPISNPASVANEVLGRTPIDNNTISAGSLSPDLKITSNPLAVRSKEATAFPDKGAPLSATSARAPTMP